MHYTELIEQYALIYEGKPYGKSGADLLEDIAPVVQKLKPKILLDYGCGYSDLSCYFWNWGETRIYRYDPAIPQYKTLYPGKADLVLCTDVLEHIPEDWVDFIIKSIKRKSERVIFSISMRKARAKLPNGMNAHITIKPYRWWRQKIIENFKGLYIMKQWSDNILFRTFK